MAVRHYHDCPDDSVWAVTSLSCGELPGVGTGVQGLTVSQALRPISFGVYAKNQRSRLPR